jgi:hypothetical protein
MGVASCVSGYASWRVVESPSLPGLRPGLSLASKQDGLVRSRLMIVRQITKSVAGSGRLKAAYDPTGQAQEEDKG